MQIISISSLKGGVGKTSVTLGLASAARAAGIPTLVVDMDPHADATTGLGVKQGSDALDVGTMLAKPKKYNLAEQVSSAGWLENDSSAQKSRGPASRRPKKVLDVVRGSSRTSIYERPTTRHKEIRRLDQLLSSLTKYALVLIDCPPALNGVTRMAWAASTDVLFVAEPSLFSVAGTERSVRALELFRSEFAPSVKRTGVVINRVRSASTEHKFRISEMERMFGNQLIPVHIPEISNWQQIQGAAWPLHDWPGETAARSANLYDELLQHVAQPASNKRARRA